MSERDLKHSMSPTFVYPASSVLREVAPENEPNMNHMLRWGRPICAKLGPGIDFGPKIRLATFFSKNFGGKFEFRAIFH